MYFLGIDIGSTCAKTVILDEDGGIADSFIYPTGWSSFNVLEQIREALQEKVDPEQMYCVATGYGRGAVAFADKVLTEITCHAKGASFLFGEGPFRMIDIGGQDTKVISGCDGRVEEFFMNDKCSAGTGKFIEIMANRLQLPIDELDRLARSHTEEQKISSMCTVFAESEIISLAAKGITRENIAWGVLHSVAVKVAGEYNKLPSSTLPVRLTGGLCDCSYLQELLADEIGQPVQSHELGRFAGAIGAARIGWERYHAEK